MWRRHNVTLCVAFSAEAFILLELKIEHKFSLYSLMYSGVVHISRNHWGGWVSLNYSCWRYGCISLKEPEKITKKWNGSNSTEVLVYVMLYGRPLTWKSKEKTSLLPKCNTSIWLFCFYYSVLSECFT